MFRPGGFTFCSYRQEGNCACIDLISRTIEMPRSPAPILKFFVAYALHVKIMAAMCAHVLSVGRSSPSIRALCASMRHLLVSASVGSRRVAIPVEVK